MEKHMWKPYLIWIVFTEAVGGLSGWLTRDGTKAYMATVEQPPLSPPSIVFPIVWAVLFALMGFGAARIYSAQASRARTHGLLLFLVQLAFNFFWSIIFFNLRAFLFAFVWLLVLLALIILTIVKYFKINRTAAYLQIPYALWGTFAGYLNLGIFILNR